jgi:glycosyltransferase involved in cell wall biosynthesis
VSDTGPARVLIVHSESADRQDRAQHLTASLSALRHRVRALVPRDAAHQPAGEYDCVISVSPSLAAHRIGYRMRRRGVAWIADVEATTFVRGSRIVRAADALTCARAETRQAIFEHLAATAAVVSDNDSEAIDRLVEALLERRRLMTNRLRILMIGPVNSPHMEHLALSMRDRGHLVQAGGALWQDGLSPSSLPEAGIPVSVMTKPQPLWLRGLIRRFRPDVIHANWMPFAALGALAGARPLVAMAWGSDVYLAEGPATLANRVAVRRADHVLADSSALVERLVELGAARERVGLLNWGVELETFKPVASAVERAAVRATLGLGEGPVIISPRGFKSLYNPGVVTEAFQRLRSVVPEAQLVLKHQGEEPPDLGELGGDPRVHVVGRVPYDRMADYFRAAEVCVSVPDTDSSPRSVWEAMACGSACVLSDLPWVHELIRDGEHALVVPARAAEVSEAIRRLLTEPALRESVARNGRRLVEEHRNASAEMDRLEELYLRLAGRRPDVGGPASIAASSADASLPVSVRRE